MICIQLFILFLFYTSALFSAAATWNVDASGNWTTKTNWNTQIVPNAVGDDALFTGVITAPRTITLTENITVGTVTFNNANAYIFNTPTANTLTFQSGGTAAINILNSNGNGAHTIFCPIVLNNDVTVNHGSTAVVSLATSISGANGLIKTSTGTLQLSGSSANTYSGLTTISAGTLLLNKTAGVNAIAGNATISGGTLTLGAANQIANTATVTLSSGIFDMAGFAETIGTLTFQGGTLTQSGGTLSLANAGTALSMRNTTITGNISITGGGSVVFDSTNNGTATLSDATLDLGSTTPTFSIGNGSATTDMLISDVISSSGAGLTKTGLGTLQFAGTSPNTYSGLTTVSSGTLLLNKTAGVTAVAGDITISGSTLTLGAANQIANTSTLTLTNGTFDMGGFAETIGTLIFNKGNLTQSGATLSLASGTTALSIRDNNITGNISITAGGSVVFDNTNNGTATLSGAILDLGSITPTFNIANGTASTDMLISDVISGSSGAGLIKTGAGTLQFAGTSDNTYDGLTTISAGTLLLNKTAGVNAIKGDATISGGTLSLAAANQIANTSTVTLSSGTFDMGGFAETIGTFTFNGGAFTQGGGTLSLASGSTALSMRDTTITGNISITAGGSVIFDSTNNGTATLSGAILDLGSVTPTFNIANGTASTDMLISDVISSSGAGVTKAGAGTLQFAGTSANTYSGLTTISAGNLLLNKTAGINAIAGDVTISGGTLTLAAANQILDTSTVIMTSGTFDIGGFAETIGTFTFNGGTLTQSGGTLSLTSGTTALSMRDTTITGNVFITAGGSVVFDSTNNGTATLSGATLDLGSLTTTFNIANGTASTDMLISDVITGSPGTGLIKTGAGTLEFAGTSSNTYDGLTTISAGTLLLNKTAGLNAIKGDATISGGTLTLAAANQIANTSTVTLTSGTFDMGGFAETIGTLTFNGGTLTQSGGTLSLTSGTTALSMRDTTITGNVSITGGGSVVFDNTNNGTATLSSATLDLGSISPIFNIANGTASTDMLISDVISGSSGIGLIKTGTGTLQFAGTSDNTYDGLTTISAGTLLLNKTAGVNAIKGDATISGGTLTLGAANQIANTSTVTLSSGTFDMGGFAETIGTLTFNGGTLTQGGGTLSLASGTTALSMRDTTITGNVSITAGGSVIFDNTNNGTATLSGAIFDLGAVTPTFNIANGTASTDMLISDVITSSGAGITKTGAGTVQFSGASANTYSGLTTISTGNLLLNKTAGINAIAGDATISGGTLTLAAANQIANTSTVTLSSGTFDMGGFAETIGTLTFNGGTFTQGGGTLNLSSGSTALSMRDTTITGNISITGGGSIVFDNTNNGTATLSSATLDLGSISPIFNIANGTASTDMLISDVISGSSGIGLTKTGTGTLQFAGTSDNTYDGLTTISAGTLLLNKTSGVNAIKGDGTISGGTLALGAANQIANTSTVTLSSGIFDMGGFAETIGTLAFNGGTLTQGGGTLSLNSGTTALSMRDTTITGNISITAGGSVIFDSTNNGTATLSDAIFDLGAVTPTFNIGNGIASTDMLISDVISSSGAGVIKVGAGTLQFSGASANTYSGLTTVSAGNLLLNKTAGTSAIAGDATITGGILTLGAANQIANTSTVTLSSGTFDMGGFAETIGTLTFNGGTLTQGGGILSLSSGSTALSMRDTTITGNIFITGGGSIVFDNTNNGTATLSGATLDLGAVTPTFNIGNGTAATDMLISDVISSSVAGVTKAGSGTLEFSGASANTYLGLTTISAGNLLLNKTAGTVAIAGDATITGGTLTFGAANQIANTSSVTLSSGTFDMGGFAETIGTFTFNGGAFTQGGGTLSLASGSTALTMRDTTITGNISITGGGSIVFDNTNNGTATLSGATLDLGSLTPTFNIANGTASTDMLISDVISSSGAGVIKAGAGTLQFAGTSANTYSGLTTVSSGNFLLNKTAGINSIAGDATISGGTLTLGAANQIANTSIVTLSSGTFDMGGFAETIGTLTFNGGTLTQGGGTLSLNSGTTALSMRDTTITGNISITTGGSVVFDNTNNGTANLSGATLDLGAVTPTFNIANGTAGTDMLISDVISGSSGTGLTKIGEGTLQFAGASDNTYNGLTTISSGTLLLNKTAGIVAIAGDAAITGGTLTLGAANQIANTSTVTLTSGTFDMGGFAETIGTLTFNGGTLTQGGGILSLSSGSTALSMRDTTIAGNVSITAGGSVVFDNSNNGTATLSGATLDLGSLTPTFNIANGAAATDMLISDVISSSGAGVIKAGAGTLQFAGTSANTYSGLTSVSAGNLLLNKTAGINAIAGDVTISGGNLSLGAANQIANTSTVTLSSGTFDMGGFAETIGTLTFNGGTLTQSGATLSLSSGTTALSMRDTTITGNISITGGGGVIFDSSNNGTALISGNVDLGGLTSSFAISEGTAEVDMLISGNISNGGLIKSAAGFLSLTGSNSYGNGTVITAGTLQGHTLSLQGSIENNASLIFNQTFDGTYSGTLSGLGTMLKNGSGALIFSNTGTLDGLTTIADGSFIVNGSYGGSGNLIINSGALLGGIGTISKNATISGTLSPGNSIGTIHLVGSQVLASGSTLEIELNPVESDIVDITGDLTIQSGVTLSIFPASGDYSTPLTYPIIQTTGGITGTFSTVTSSSPLFTPSITYTATEVLLSGFFSSFSSLFRFGNAGVVARTLDDLSPSPGSDLAFVIQELREITSVELLQDALLQMQPSAFTSLSIAQENNALYVRNAISNHLELQSNLCHCNCQKKNLFWISPLLATSEQENHHLEPGFTTLTPGIFVGLDSYFSQFSHFGLGMGYTYTDLHWRKNRGNAAIHSLYGSFYGDWKNQRSYFRGVLFAGYSEYSIDRRIEFGSGPGIHRIAKSVHHGIEGTINGKAGLFFNYRAIDVSPFINVDCLFLKEEGFQETGANSLDLSVAGKYSNLISSEIGLDFSHCFSDFGSFFQVSAIRESRFRGAKEKSYLEGSEMITFGLSPSRTLGGIKLGFNHCISSHFFSLFYRGKYTYNFQDHALYVEVGF